MKGKNILKTVKGVLAATTIGMASSAGAVDHFQEDGKTIIVAGQNDTYQQVLDRVGKNFITGDVEVDVTELIQPAQTEILSQICQIGGKNILVTNDEGNNVLKDCSEEKVESEPEKISEPSINQAALTLRAQKPDDSLEVKIMVVLFALVAALGLTAGYLTIKNFFRRRKEKNRLKNLPEKIDSVTSSIENFFQENFNISGDLEWKDIRINKSPRQELKIERSSSHRLLKYLKVWINPETGKVTVFAERTDETGTNVFDKQKNFVLNKLESASCTPLEWTDSLESITCFLDTLKENENESRGLDEKPELIDELNFIQENQNRAFRLITRNDKEKGECTVSLIVKSGEKYYEIFFHPIFLPNNSGASSSGINFIPHHNKELTNYNGPYYPESIYDLNYDDQHPPFIGSQEILNAELSEGTNERMQAVNDVKDFLAEMRITSDNSELDTMGFDTGIKITNISNYLAINSITVHYNKKPPYLSIFIKENQHETAHSLDLPAPSSWENSYLPLSEYFSAIEKEESFKKLQTSFQKVMAEIGFKIPEQGFTESNNPGESLEMNIDTSEVENLNSIRIFIDDKGIDCGIEIRESDGTQVSYDKKDRKINIKNSGDVTYLATLKTAINKYFEGREILTLGALPGFFTAKNIDIDIIDVEKSGFTANQEGGIDAVIFESTLFMSEDDTNGWELYPEMGEDFYKKETPMRIPYSNIEKLKDEIYEVSDKYLGFGDINAALADVDTAEIDSDIEGSFWENLTPDTLAYDLLQGALSDDEVRKQVIDALKDIFSDNYKNGSYQTYYYDAVTNENKIVTVTMDSSNLKIVTKGLSPVQIEKSKIMSISELLLKGEKLTEELSNILLTLIGENSKYPLFLETQHNELRSIDEKISDVQEREFKEDKKSPGYLDALKPLKNSFEQYFHDCLSVLED